MEIWVWRTVDPVRVAAIGTDERLYLFMEWTRPMTIVWNPSREGCKNPSSLCVAQCPLSCRTLSQKFSVHKELYNFGFLNPGEDDFF
jgi:hypothetical protein